MRASSQCRFFPRACIGSCRDALAIAADSEAKLVLTTAKMNRQSEDLFKRAPELGKP